MTTIAVLGANGRIARIAEDMLLAHDDIELTLFIHTEDELGADIKDNPRVTVVKGDAKNPDDVLNAINGADEVYANLAATPTVKVGDAVSTGTIIGSVGGTAALESGLASHIHYALLKEGYPVDPADYLPQR